MRDKTMQRSKMMKGYAQWLDQTEDGHFFMKTCVVGESDDTSAAVSTHAAFFPIRVVNPWALPWAFFRAVAF